MRAFAAAVLVVVAFASMVARADEITVIKTGEVIHGKVIKESEGVATIALDDGGTRTCFSHEIEVKAGPAGPNPSASPPPPGPAHGAPPAKPAAVPSACPDCSGTKRVVCAQCHGKPIDSRPCEACGRKGRVPCPDCLASPGKPAGRQVCVKCNKLGTIETDCPLCNGSGKKSCPDCTKGTVQCRPCRGGGVVGAGTAYCGECRGTGKQTCSTCRGKAEIDCYKRARLDCPVCYREGTVACPTCKGRPISKCAACDGSGKIGLKCPGCADKRFTPCPRCGGVAQQLDLILKAVRNEDLTKLQREERARTAVGSLVSGELEVDDVEEDGAGGFVVKARSAGVKLVCRSLETEKATLMTMAKGRAYRVTGRLVAVTADSAELEACKFVKR